MNRSLFFKSCFALSLAWTGLGCGVGDASPSSDSPASSTGANAMGATMDALAAAVNTCDAQRDACSENLGDATADRSCQEAFQACKKDAIDKAIPDLTNGVSVCSEQARTCRAAAADDAAKSACHETLKECVGEAHPESDAGVDRDGKRDEHPKADGGDNGGDHTSPVASCTSALRTCIEGEEEAKVCTDALRACLDTVLPNRGDGQENRPDAGKADQDHGNNDGGKPDNADRGQGDEHKPADAGVDDSDPRGKPEKPERDGGRGKPQA